MRTSGWHVLGGVAWLGAAAMTAAEGNYEGALMRAMFGLFCFALANVYATRNS